MSEAKQPGAGPAPRITLTTAEEDPELRSAAMRDATSSALRLGRQRSEAAETLWVAGHGAEALALARRALESTLDGASSERRSRGVSLPPPPPGQEAWSQVLRKRLRPGELDTLRAVRAELMAAPLLDRDVDASHARLFRRPQRTRDAVDRAITPLARAPRSAHGPKLRRLAIGVVLGLVLVAGAVLLLRPRSLDATVAASGAYLGDPRYAGVKAFDGDPATEWQLDDRQRGWVERRFPNPVPMGRVVLRNGHNAHWMDRGVRSYRVELYDAQDREVHRLRASFPAIEEDPTPKVHALPQDLPPIGRLRVVVESYFDLGASLAEVSWEPPGARQAADAGAAEGEGDQDAGVDGAAVEAEDEAHMLEARRAPVDATARSAEARGEPGDEARPEDEAPSRAEEGERQALPGAEIPE